MKAKTTITITKGQLDDILRAHFAETIGKQWRISGGLTIDYKISATTKGYGQMEMQHQEFTGVEFTFDIDAPVKELLR